MTAPRVTCTACGATTAATGDVAHCSSCGTALPSSARPTRVGVHPTNGKLAYLGLFGVAVVSLIVSFELVRRHETPSTPAVPAISATPERIVTGNQTQAELETKARAAEESIDRYWETARPILVDVDGDSVADAIGTVRYVIHRDELRVVAHSGKDGHLLWESESLGSKLVSQQETLARVDNVIVWGSTYDPLIAGFDVTTGKQLWKVAPDEVLDHYCRVNDRFLLVLKDKTQLTLERGTGAPKKLAAPIECREATRQGAGLAVPDFKIEGMDIYEHYGDADGVIFTGRKALGTEVAMIAAAAPDGTLLWTAKLSAHAPLRARRPTSSTPDFDRDLVAEPIQDGDKPSLEVFDRATGTRELDVPIFTNSRLPFLTISTIVSKAAIYVVIQEDLQAYSRTTGALLWHLRH